MNFESSPECVLLDGETGEGRILPIRNEPAGLIIKFLNQMVSLEETARQLGEIFNNGHSPSGPFKLTIMETDK